MCALDLLAWLRAIGLNGALARATPKTLRYRLLHIAGQTSNSGRVPRLDTT